MPEQKCTVLHLTDLRVDAPDKIGSRLKEPTAPKPVHEVK